MDITGKLQKIIIIPIIFIAPILLYLFAEIQGYVNVVSFGSYPLLYYPQAIVFFNEYLIEVEVFILLILLVYLPNNSRSDKKRATFWAALFYILKSELFFYSFYIRAICCIYFKKVSFINE